MLSFSCQSDARFLELSTYGSAYLIFLLEVGDPERVVEDYLVVVGGRRDGLFHDEGSGFEGGEGQEELIGLAGELPVEDLQDCQHHALLV